ncbi:MAG: hypothetical protein ACRERV_04715 [Methylococcales bacterium]
MKPKMVFWWFCLIVWFVYATVSAEDRNEIQNPQDEVLPPPEFKVIEKWRGTWDVKVLRREPEPVEEVTYSESHDWILDGRYLRSETSRKSDGGKSMSILWFDMLMKTYRLVIFDASGLAVELPSPTWNESTQTMEWESGLFSPVSFTGYITFMDPNTIRFKSILKDWKGTVILDLEGTSIRRK